MTGDETTFQFVSEMAYEAAGLLLNEEDGDLDTELAELAAELERLILLDEERLRSLARCARRSPFDVLLWLRGTAVLCRLVQTGEEEPGELVERQQIQLYAIDAIAQAIEGRKTIRPGSSRHQPIVFQPPTPLA